MSVWLLDETLVNLSRGGQLRLFPLLQTVGMETGPRFAITKMFAHGQRPKMFMGGGARPNRALFSHSSRLSLCNQGHCCGERPANSHRHCDPSSLEVAPVVLDPCLLGFSLHNWIIQPSSSRPAARSFHGRHPMQHPGPVPPLLCCLFQRQSPA